MRLYTALVRRFVRFYARGFQQPHTWDVYPWAIMCGAFYLMTVCTCGVLRATHIKTVDDIAHEACSAFFARERGISLEQAAATFCATEEALRPFLIGLRQAERTARVRALSREGQAR